MTPLQMTSNTSRNSKIAGDLWVSAQLNPVYYYPFYCLIVLYYCSFLLYLINALTIMARNCEFFLKPIRIDKIDKPSLDFFIYS